MGRKRTRPVLRFAPLANFPILSKMRPRFLWSLLALLVSSSALFAQSTQPSTPPAVPTPNEVARPTAAAADSVFFENKIRPILKERCITCHSTEKQKGDLDLERFASVESVTRDPVVWEHALEQLANNEMPPQGKPQLNPEQKTTLKKWIQSTLDQAARANAGDPGPVVLRRLSNMEYTYTIRDLTGVGSLDPAKEFPVDGAAGEGFTNAGAALVMSPALLTKYLDAAKEVASHAVLLPESIRFSPSNSQQDWTDETLAAIRAIYTRHTASGAGSQITQQGIKLDTGTGAGRLPLARYLDALQGRGSAEGLSPKYLGILRAALSDTERSVLLDPLRAKFKDRQLTPADIEPWQRVLCRFGTVGHIGKENGPKSWQEPVTPLVPQHEMRVKLNSDREIALYLTTGDAGDGAVGDEVGWENPRLVAPGRPDLPIAGLGDLVKHLETQRTKIIATAEACLSALADSGTHADPDLLVAWREYLGYGTTKLDPLLTKKMESTPDYNFIKGWTGDNGLSVLANSSDATVRIPGVMKAHSVATHPSPKLASVIAWRSPVNGRLTIRGGVADAHPECGNGITWALELRRGHTSEVLASGVSKGATVLTMGPFPDVQIETGQVVALVIGPRDGNHACDLTAVNLTLSDGETTWDLAKDLSPNILAGNPNGAWHFLSQPAAIDAAPNLPAPIAEWRKAPSAVLAAKVREYLEKDFPLTNPLLGHAMRSFRPTTAIAVLKAAAPSVIEIQIPAALAKGTEFVVTGRLASKADGSVQMRVLTEKPSATQGLVAGAADSTVKHGEWSDDNLVTQHSAPIIVNHGSESRKRFEDAFNGFRALFPIALCYSKIVPVDEVITLTLFHREDDHLRRLILDETETRELDRLWDELLFVSEAPRKQVDVFEQLFQYKTQVGTTNEFEPLRQPLLKAAQDFEAKLKAADAKQRQAVIEFAAKAWRRPLTGKEITALREFPPRLMLARVLTSPALLYRGELAPEKTGPVNGQELATRLSYFLWSSAPDAALRADADKLHDPEILAAHAKRMLKNEKVRRLATEFGCQWLHVRDVAELDEKSERHFPTFASVRADMQEEVTRFFIDLIQNDRSVLSLLNADHTFVNETLAKHYGLAVKGGDWQRIDGLHGGGRGGILGFAATLAKHSGASRTSPILRGNWLSEVVLGEKLPRPPKGVPILPDEAPAGLTERQLIERHSSDETCASCHKRIDPFGYALEGFDAIGRSRERDTATVLADGTAIQGFAGLRDYLVTKRRDDFLRQFSRKLLGYALGRSVQLSDKPLIEAMVKSEGHRIGGLVAQIIHSPQFREVRGKNLAANP